MSSVVKAQSSDDPDKPPNYWTVQYDQIVIKNRDLRSDNPDEFYHLSTLTTPPHDIKFTPEASPNSSNSSTSDGEFLASLNLHDNPNSTDETYFLGAKVNSTTAPTSVIYTDSPTDRSPRIPSAPPVILSPQSVPIYPALDQIPDAIVPNPPLPTIHHPVVIVPIHNIAVDEIVHAGVDNISDTESEFEMDSNISPSNFKGTTTENAQDWLRHFENYCLYKAYDDAKAKALFRVVLTDSAAVWYDSLELAVVNDWNALKNAFKARYTTPEFMRYKHANDLFNTKQGDSSVDDYCAKMQRLAKDVGADDTMLRFAVINGLRPDIRNHVTRCQPTTWKDLLDNAKVGEMCVPVSATADSSVSVKLELIQDQLQQLASKKDQPQMTASASPQPNRRSQSQSPRRVRFQEGNDGDNGHTLGYDDDRGTGNYSAAGGRFRPTERYDDGRNMAYADRRFDDRRPRYFDRSWSNNRSETSGHPMSGGRQLTGYQRQWNGSGFQPRGVTFGDRPFNRGRGRQFQSQNAENRGWSQTPPPMCSKCGLSNHEHPNACPAINQNCRGCGRKGHFLRVCRTTARMQVNYD